MAGEWEPVRLGKYIRLRKGVSYQGKYLDQAGPRLLGLGTIIPGGGARLDNARTYGGEIRSQQRIVPGELFVALTDITQEGRILGSPALLPPDAKGEYAVTHHVARVEVVDDRKIDVRYLFYLLQGERFRSFMHGRATGTTVRAVAHADAENFDFDRPPLSEQRAIAHILGTLDEKIELNRRMSGTLEAMARALFKSWFVDFDPVRAKAEGRDPGLPKLIADFFPARLVDSELGEIPEGWEVGTLGDIAENPRRCVKPELIAPDMPYIALEHMPKQRIALLEWGRADGLESNKFYFKKGEILFGKLRPYFHKVGVAPIDGVCSTDIVVVAPCSMQWYGFVLGNVSSVAFVEYTNAGSTGTKMPRTSWHYMARYTIALPTDPLAAAFTCMIRPVVDRIIADVHESHILAALRDALLPKLISGELRIKDAEKFLGRAGI